MDRIFKAQVKVSDLAGGRGGFALFSGIGFTLDSGAALRVTGPNGSGKSTLLRAIAGLLRPDRGHVAFMLDGAEAQAADATHYLGHLNAMKAQLTVAENLRFWSCLGGGGDDALWHAALEETGLGRVRDLPFGYLSAGQKRRVAIARLVASPRAIWLLDEPTAGLDAAASARFETLLDTHLGQGGIVIAATHTPLGTARWRDISTGVATGERQGLAS